MRRALALTIALALGPRQAAAQPDWVDAAGAVAPLRARVDALVDAPETQRGLRYLLDRSVRLAAGGRRPADDPWVTRAERYLERAEAGEDPYVTAARGEITLRAYRSPICPHPVGYAVYVPPDYDPSRRYPLLVALHGGSSSANLFLGQVLGARVPFDTYRERWDDVFAPARSPDWIVVAPGGFGNSMWRFQGERDALDVMAHALAHYAVDPERVVLHGLSNGGLGSHNIGLRHAWRFSAVVPAAGAPGWLTYLGGRPRPGERRALLPLSGASHLIHARLTHLHLHHGQRDPGPMRPVYTEALASTLRARSLPFALDWYATGHDLVEPVHRAGSVFEHEATATRARRPRAVELVTGDYRAARQHWVEVTGIARYPQLARVDARVEGGAVVVRTRRVDALTLHLRAAPVPEGPLDLRVDGTTLSLPGPRGRVHLVRTPDGWSRGRLPPTRKRPGLSGPIPDAYHEPLVHVYGSLRPEEETTLREAAQAGARGFFGSLLGFRQEVVRDVELTAEHATRAHLVLYGDTRSNAVLAAARGRLPIEADAEGITAHGVRFEGRHVGARFIYPSPFVQDRYVLVATGADAAAVLAGDRLPAFLPDWVIYDARDLPERRTQLAGRHPPLASGFFDDRWR